MRRLRQPDALLLGGLLVAVVARIAFWAYTDRVWEDALITLKHAENAAAGAGLIHHPGEGHVQGFTSALSVLIPLPAEMVWPGSGLTALRLTSLVAAAVSIVYAYRIASVLRLSRWATGFVLAYLALEHHQVLFGMAGMETEVAVAILLAGAYYVLVDDPRRVAVMLGLALLVRPDFILWVAVVLCWYLVRARRDDAAIAAAGTLLVAGPWFLFATIYYGSPIPETIRAKAATFSTLPEIADGFGTWLRYLVEQPVDQARLWRLFAPFLSDARAQEVPVRSLLQAVAYLLMALTLVGAWRLWREHKRWRPMLVFVGVYALYVIYGGSVHSFAWYLPPVFALVVLIAAAGLDVLRPRAPHAVAAASAALMVAYAVPLAFAFPLERRVQQIETHVRRELGQYLAGVVDPGETLASESSGYVGYFGNFRLLDYPGLTSPRSLRVVKTIRREERYSIFGFVPFVLKLQPDWIVARGYEAELIAQRDPTMPERYSVATRFQIPTQRLNLRAGPVEWATIDNDFLVLKKMP